MEDYFGRMLGKTIRETGSGYYADGVQIIKELSKPLRLEIESWKEEYTAVIERYLHQ